MVRRDAVILTAGQVDDLAEAASPYGALVYLLAYGGLRWGEAAALRRRRCDLLRGRLEVAEAVSDVNGHLYYGSTKTYERRWVRIPTFLVELLARQLESVPADPEALVFIGLRGAPLRYQSFRRAIWDRAVPVLDSQHRRLPAHGDREPIEEPGLTQHRSPGRCSRRSRSALPTAPVLPPSREGDSVPSGRSRTSRCSTCLPL
jgi:integrase